MSTTPDSGQLPLGLHWPAQQRFEHFVVGENALALAACVRAASEPGAPWVLLSGARGSGKSHLLLAACQQATESDFGAQYLPLRELPAPRADAIRGAGGRMLVAVDDVDAIAGDDAAQHALFDLYNRCRGEGASMLFAAARPPAAMDLGLPDLASRLGTCTRLTLQPLAEPARRAWLRERAAGRGIELDDAVLEWLFRYHPRDLGSLGALLERLDRASLAAHRRITIPFLRDLLAQPSE